MDRVFEVLIVAGVIVMAVTIGVLCAVAGVAEVMMVVVDSGVAVTATDLRVLTAK